MAHAAGRTDTMQALVLVEPRRIEVQTVPVPEPAAGEVLIKVRAAPTCGTDLKAYLRGHPQIPMPGQFGHEYSGTVVAVGPGAPFAVGDDVMGVHSAPCQTCQWCLRDQENLCESIMATKVLGSYAEYLLVPDRIARLNMFHKPDSLSFEVAALLEPLACVAQAVERLQPSPERSVLVIGPGSIGLMFSAVLKHLGVKDVTLAGRNPERLKVGRQLGADTVAYGSSTRQYDTVIECTGKLEVWQAVPALVQRGGTALLFGGCPTGASVTWDTRKIHYDDLTIISPFHFGTRAVRTARTWLTSQGFDLSALFSGTRSLQEADTVFQDLESGRGIKYVFNP